MEDGQALPGVVVAPHKFSDKDKYFHTIENFFLAAEMHEQVALYSALPVFAYQECWLNRCAQGIRSNIGDVLLSIMCHYPYPSEQMDNSVWNQMVLKAFFTEKPVHQIIGLDERANKELSMILSDYARERFSGSKSDRQKIIDGFRQFNEPTFLH